MKQLQHKKTFWMNVVGVVGWVLISALALYLSSIEHTTKHLIISALLHLCVLATPTVTAIYLYSNSNKLLDKLALIGNYCGVIGATCYVLFVAYKYPTVFVSFEVVGVIFVFLIFTIPCLINLQVLKKV
jgi:hypothetical protein